ncbi:perforin-1.3 [Salarias fasciatus]|uniref:Perforin-1-like n=1 Tax=Salarias fasciatus TaxID=181472 RepID=A0A672F4B6_SALFA|nr:perforin-1-like [Salarias fasciatus]
MLLLLLLLLRPPPCAGCQASSFTECQVAPFVAGHDLAGEGFDVVTMKTTGAGVVDLKTFMVGGVKGNCTVCHNRLLQQTQKLPAAVRDWKVKVQCKRHITSKIFDSSQSVMKEEGSSVNRSWKVGLKIGGLAGFATGGSHSDTTKFVESRSKRDKSSFLTHHFQCEYYSLQLRSSPPLTEDFQKSLNNLPSTHYHRNTSAFRRFISTYGTHFIRGVTLGGRLHAITAVRTCEAAMGAMSAHTVGTCLSVEASATIGFISSENSVKFCNEKMKSLRNATAFSRAFSDRMSSVSGGDGDVSDVLFGDGGAAAYLKWLRSLKRVPGVVSYWISPLHQLVTDNPMLRSTLQDAISDYIRRRAKSLQCPASCPIGHRTPSCACRCHGHRMVDANCCPAAPGVARLGVTVVRAEGLWGDDFTRTDGYVKVRYGAHGATTPVVWNDDFPQWNYQIHFGSVNLGGNLPVRFEVWDRDHAWDDDLLGSASVFPTAGGKPERRFRLKHGALIIRLTVQCAPSLQGALCQQYAPSPARVERWGSGWSAAEEGASRFSTRDKMK